MTRLSDRAILITGAAGSIGEATARLFAREGARLVLADREPEALEPLAASLGATWLAGDVVDAAHVRRLVALAVERHGGLDGVVAHAGVFGAVAPVTEYPEDAFDHVMAVNVRGPFLVCKHALAAMRPGGSVVLTSSVVGLTSDPNICAYATSKHALVGLMRTAAAEMAPRGIRVNTLHPGPVDNSFQQAIEIEATGADAATAAERFEAMIPLGRHARPDEVASAALFLCSEESSFMTGAALALDGGMTI